MLPGRETYARWYDVTSLLSEDDCTRILNRINSGRDLAARALSTRLDRARLANRLNLR